MGKRPFTGVELGERSLRILVSPPPVTFAERRSVLHALEQHGRMVHFKGTPGYNSNFVSITKDVEAARKLIASSPIHYGMMLPRIESDPALADLEETSLTESVRVESTYADDAPRDRKEFKMHIFPTMRYNHEHAMSSSPVYNAWPDAYERDHSLAATTLKQSLPHNIARKGLAHWLVDNDGASQQTLKDRRIRTNEWLPSRMTRVRVEPEDKMRSRSKPVRRKERPQAAESGQTRESGEPTTSSWTVPSPQAVSTTGLWERMKRSKLLEESPSRVSNHKARSSAKAGAASPNAKAGVASPNVKAGAASLGSGSKAPVLDAFDKMKGSRVHEGSKKYSGEKTLTW